MFVCFCETYIDVFAPKPVNNTNTISKLCMIVQRHASRLDYQSLSMSRWRDEPMVSRQCRKTFMRQLAWQSEEDIDAFKALPGRQEKRDFINSWKCFVSWEFFNNIFGKSAVEQVIDDAEEKFMCELAQQPQEQIDAFTALACRDKRNFINAWKRFASWKFFNNIFGRQQSIKVEKVVEQVVEKVEEDEASSTPSKKKRRHDVAELIAIHQKAKASWKTLSTKEKDAFEGARRRHNVKAQQLTSQVEEVEEDVAELALPWERLTRAKSHIEYRLCEFYIVTRKPNPNKQASKQTRLTEAKASTRKGTN